MSITSRPTDEGRRCFTYCGDDRCTCDAREPGLGYRMSPECRNDLERLRQAQRESAHNLARNPPILD